MPLHTTEAIVLRTYQLGETDRIVVLLTRDRGKKRGVARGARRSRRRFGGALEPMTRVRVAYFERENRELVALDYAEPLQSPLAAAAPEAPAYAGYFAELLDEWAPSDHPNEKLFRLAAATGNALASGTSVPALARYLEFWLLRLEGVYPSVSACGGCGRSLDGSGCSLAAAADALVCLACAPRTEADISPAALGFLRHALVRPPAELALAPLAACTLRELEALHRMLLSRHLDREPRAMRVLREMDASLTKAAAEYERSPASRAVMPLTTAS